MAEAPQQLPPKGSRVELRVSAGDLRSWREAAVRDKLSLSEWIRHACDDRATKETKKR